MTYGLGRLHAPDPRDQLHPMPKLISARTSRFWWGYRVRLDQGQTPQCVAYAWSHFIVDSPTTHPAPLITPQQLYDEAQTLDEWPGEGYDGTSVRAGAKALLAHAEVAGEYLWATDVDTLVANVLEVGPVVVGVNWYEQMFTPDKDNFVRIGGAVAGGHAFKIDGVNTYKQFVRMKNSWGSGWGHSGFARITFPDLARLLAEDGEACMAVEVKAP